MEGDKVRGKPEKFAEHFAQATLFWNSQTEYEKAHIVRGFRFELTKVTVPAIRERTVSMLRNVSDELAAQVAEGLGISLPRPMPRLAKPTKAEVEASPTLSLTARPGDGSIRGMNVAILIAPGITPRSVEAVRKPLAAAGAVVRLVGPRLGSVDGLQADGTLETMPSVLFDGVVVPDGEGGADELGALGQALEFLKDQYRHAKPICYLGNGISVLEEAGVPADDASDWAVVSSVDAFLEALARRRNWERQIDPPPI